MARTKFATTSESSIDHLVAIFQQRSFHPEPKFLKLRSTILRGIESGILRPGDRLPSDINLAKAFDVSLGTVQKSFKVLSEEFVVTRRQGVGTTIESHRIEMKDVWHFRFVGPDRKTLLPLKAKATSVKRIREKGPWGEHIGEDDAYVRIQRRITVNSEFNVFSEFYFGASRFGDLLEMDESEFDLVILKNLVAEKYNLPILRPSQLLSCVQLPEEVCDVIEVERGSYGIYVEVVGFDHYDRPVYFQRLYCPSSASPLLIR